VASSPIATFVSPIDMSGGLISCTYTTKETWVERFGGWGVRAAQWYVKLLGRLAAP
jgi:hypothetical protein